MECVIYQKVKKAGLAKKEIKKMVFFILKKLKKKSSEVSVHLVGGRMIKKINCLYRGKDEITDVIAFAMQEGEWRGDKSDLGDIFLCLPRIREQAKFFRVAYKEEFARMLAHGILHLLGYDHQRRKDCEEM